jgi:hypothetical protein
MAVTAMAAVNSFGLIMMFLSCPGGPHHRAADRERDRALRLRIPDA